MKEQRPSGLEIQTANQLVDTLRKKPQAAFPHVVWDLEDFRDSEDIKTAFTFNHMLGRVTSLRLKGDPQDQFVETGSTEQFGLAYRYKAQKSIYDGVLIGQQKRYALIQPTEENQRIDDGKIYTPYITFGLYGFDAESRYIGIELTRYRRTISHKVDVYLLLEGKDHLDELRDPTHQLTVNDILAAPAHVTRKLFVGDPGLKDDFQYETAKRLGIL